MDSTLPILAVDLGKFNSVPCGFSTSSGEVRSDIGVLTAELGRRGRPRSSGLTTWSATPLGPVAAESRTPMLWIGPPAGSG
jgi:hypothetical protein